VTLRRLLILLLGLVGALVGGGLLAHTVLIPTLIHRQQAVLVPDLAGLSLEEAENQVHRVGLRLEVGEEVYREGADPGTVLEQVPSTLRSVRRGRTVRVTLAKGEAYARVPDLLGLSLRQCEITLLRDGLQVGRVARSYDPLGGVGIAAQRPHPGTEVARGSRVDLVLREDTERSHYRMPRLIGRSLVQVREELGRAGFELRRITYRKDGEAFPGTILEQWPTAGSRIPEGGSIELVASSRG
jgi:serine/threonine-protein kinase